MILFLTESKLKCHLSEYRRNDELLFWSVAVKNSYIFHYELLDCKHDLYIFWLIIFPRYSLMIFLLIYFETKMLRLFRMIISNHDITLSCVKVILIIYTTLHTIYWSTHYCIYRNFVCHSIQIVAIVFASLLFMNLICVFMLHFICYMLENTIERWSVHILEAWVSIAFVLSFQSKEE